MTRAELYSEIFRSILSNHADTILNIDEIQLEFDLNGLYGALPIILSTETRISNSNLRRLLLNMSYRLNDIEIEDNGRLAVLRLEYQKNANKRDFIWHSQELSVINCDMLFKECPNYPEQLMLVVEQICYGSDKRNDFLNYLKTDSNDGINEFYIIYDTGSYPIIDGWKLYMYGLGLYLNQGRIISYNGNLVYNSTTHHTSLTYNNDAKYNQYIDIYDVISEWNDCKDVLSAFLKMYQILEYIVYRKEFVDIINGANIKQSFVRHIKGVDRKFSNDERGVFTKGIKDIFSFNGRVNMINVTSDVEDFCKKYYPLNKNGDTYMTRANLVDTNQVDNCIAKFIYDTRCSIVHNKESEFHMTTINYSEYASILPLMQDIMEIVGNEVFDVMSNHENKIAFKDPVLDLY